MTKKSNKDPLDVWHQPGGLLPKFVGQPGQACADADPELFYSATERAAKAICNTTPCRWRAECLQFALAMSRRQDQHGVWGGTGPQERRLLRSGKIQADQVWSEHRSQRSADARRSTSSYTDAGLVEQTTDCRRRFAAGEQIKDIAKALGISTRTVTKRIGPEGHRAREAAVAEQIAECVRRFDAGEDLPSLAVAFRVSPWVVGKWIGPERVEARRVLLAEQRAAARAKPAKAVPARPAAKPKPAPVPTPKPRRDQRPAAHAKPAKVTQAKPAPEPKPAAKPAPEPKPKPLAHSDPEAAAGPIRAGRRVHPQISRRRDHHLHRANAQDRRADRPGMAWADAPPRRHLEIRAFLSGAARGAGGSMSRFAAEGPSRLRNRPKPEPQPEHCGQPTQGSPTQHRSGTNRAAPIESGPGTVHHHQPGALTA